MIPEYEERTEGDGYILIVRSLGWRSNGASGIVEKSLHEAHDTLEALPEAFAPLKRLLDEYGVTLSLYDQTRELRREFSDVSAPVRELEINLRHCVSTAILMAAIQLENSVNFLCYYDLGRTMADAMESLGLEEKIEIAHRVFGLPQFAGTHEQEAVRRLVRWRNAFAHGKDPSLPSDRSIWRNNTRRLERFTTAEGTLRELVRYMRYYSMAEEHIANIKPPWKSGVPETQPVVDVERLVLDLYVDLFESYGFEGGFVSGRTRELPHVERKLRNWRTERLLPV